MGKLRPRAAAHLVEVVPQQLAYDEEVLLVVKVLVELHRTAVAARASAVCGLAFPLAAPHGTGAAEDGQHATTQRAHRALCSVKHATGGGHCKGVTQRPRIRRVARVLCVATRCTATQCRMHPLAARWTLRHIALRSRLHNMMRVVAVVRVQVLE
jgi:hypothetical protein